MATVVDVTIAIALLGAMSLLDRPGRWGVEEGWRRVERERDSPCMTAGGSVDVGDICNWTPGVVLAGGSGGDAATHVPG